MSTRDQIINETVSDRDAMVSLLDAYRAEVLTEAATVAESLRRFERQYGPAASGAQVSENVGILRVSAELRRMAGKDTSDGSQPPAGESTQPSPDLTARICDSITTFNQTACWRTLQHAPARQHLAEHLAATLADLARAAENRDYWHAELMHADARIAELGRKVAAGAAQPAPGRCGRALSTGQPCPDHPVTDPTPLAVRWDRTVIHPEADPTEPTIVCCIAADTGQPVALFLDDEHREALGLLLVDPDGDGEVYADVPDDEPDARVQESAYKLRALLAGGHAAAPVVAPRFTDTNSDEWVRCSSSHCPNCERYEKAKERGWVNGHMDSWHCPAHAARPAEGEVPRG